MTKKSDKPEKPTIIRTYTNTIKYKCPIRGWVTEEARVDVYTPIAAPNPKLTSEEIAELMSQYDSADLSVDDI